MPDGLVRCQPTPRGGFGGLGARHRVAILTVMDAITTVCLVRPEVPQDAQSIADMRRAIEHDGARPGSLVGECLDAARAGGLTEEETYVFLAYQALLRLEETQQRHIYLSELAPFLESVPPSPQPGVVAPAAASIAARIVGHVRSLLRGATPVRAVSGAHPIPQPGKT